MKFNYRFGSIDPLPTAENILHEDKSKVKITHTDNITSSGAAARSGYINMMDGNWTVSYVETNNTWRCPTGAHGYWHCAANWSLGHVPTSNENVLFSSQYKGTCMIHGDVNVRNFIVMGDCNITISAGLGITIQANSLNLGTMATLNWNEAQATVNINSPTIRGGL